MSLGAILADQLDGTRDWTMRLLSDIGGGDWTFAPAAGLAHPLWICGHLAVSQHLLIHVRCLGRGVLDEDFCANFPIGGPVPGADRQGYPPPDELLAVMAATHERTLEAVQNVDGATLAEPAFGAGGQPHPHYRDKLGAITHCMRHEAFHAGQLAMIRRLLGKPFLR